MCDDSESTLVIRAHIHKPTTTNSRSRSTYAAFYRYTEGRMDSLDVHKVKHRLQGDGGSDSFRPLVEKVPHRKKDRQKPF